MFDREEGYSDRHEAIKKPNGCAPWYGAQSAWLIKSSLASDKPGNDLYSCIDTGSALVVSKLPDELAEKMRSSYYKARLFDYRRLLDGS